MRFIEIGVGLGGLVTVAGLACGCAPLSGDSGTSTLRVAAASSLAETFTELGRDYQHANPTVRIEFDFGSSTALATSLPERRDVDVFASADAESMRRAVEAGAARRPQLLARNRIVLAVPAGNPSGVRTLADLPDSRRRVVLCAGQAPCGRAAAELLQSAGVPDLVRADLRPDARSTLGAIRAGEADAGLVFATDAERAAPNVEVIPVEQVVDSAGHAAGETEYFVAETQDADPSVTDFLEFLLSAQTRQQLERAGFRVPAG